MISVHKSVSPRLNILYLFYFYLFTHYLFIVFIFRLGFNGKLIGCKAKLNLLLL